MLVPYIVHVSYLLWEGWWHWVGHHWWWGRWLLGLWWWWLRVERERRVVHAILSGTLHGPKLRGALEALVTKGTHLVCWWTEITLSVAVAVIVVAIATTRVTTVTPIAATILGLIATKGTLRPVAKPSITVPVPVATTAKVAPPTPRIPIPTVILVATSSPPSTTWNRWRWERREGRLLIHVTYNNMAAKLRHTEINESLNTHGKCKTVGVIHRLKGWLEDTSVNVPYR